MENINSVLVVTPRAAYLDDAKQWIDKLDKPGEGKVIYDKLPGGDDHSWKYIRIKDDKLYFPIGAPCNICDPGEYAKIYRMNLDGTGIETLAAGVRKHRSEALGKAA